MGYQAVWGYFAGGDLWVRELRWEKQRIDSHGAGGRGERWDEPKSNCKPWNQRGYPKLPTSLRAGSSIRVRIVGLLWWANNPGLIA